MKVGGERGWKEKESKSPKNRTKTLSARETCRIRGSLLLPEKRENFTTKGAKGVGLAGGRGRSSGSEREEF